MGSCCTTGDDEAQAFGRQVNAGMDKRNDVQKAMNILFERNNTFMKLDLRFKARELPNIDSGTKTDSFCVIFEHVKDPGNPENGQWIERGRTEIVVNTNDPSFVKTISIDYYFEQDQEFLVLLHDSDNFENDTISLAGTNYIGQNQFKIQNLVCNRDKEIEIPLHDKEGQGAGTKGYVTINYEEELSCTNQDLKLAVSMFEGNFIENRAYFIEISKIKPHPSNESIKIFRSEK